MSADGTLHRYVRAFAVEARHEFFADGRCPALAFAPTDATRALLHNRGMLHRDTPTGFAVFRVADAAGAASPQAPLLAFTFRMTASDPAFGRYTELDSPDAGTLLQFDSARSAAPDDDGGRRLQVGEHVAGPDRVAVDAPGLDAALDARDRAAPPLGIVTIRAPQRQAGDAGQGEVYTLAFRARRTFWKYYVLGGADDAAATSIRDADGAVKFDLSGPALLPGGRRAVVLRSTTAIALRERPTQRFQLRVKTPSGERVLIKRLALASPQWLGQDTVDGRAVTVAEIYVNL